MRHLLVFLVACGGDDATRQTSVTPAPPPAASQTTVVDPPAPKTEAIPPECTGADIDVAKAFAACASTSLPGSTIDALNRLTVKVAPPAKVAPGAKADIAVTLTNESDAAMTLRLLPMPWSAVTKTSMGPHPCGTTVHGSAILKQLEDAHAPASSGPAATIVIPPKGVAHAAIPWEANGKKWGPAVKDKSNTCTADALVAPLPAGTYSVTVRVPAVGVTIPEQTVSIVVP